jgi:hypothetical protein
MMQRAQSRKRFWNLSRKGVRMSTDSSFLSIQGSMPENLVTETDYSCLQEPTESTLNWEAAWIDIGGEG